jgi:hypothetical protein
MVENSDNKEMKTTRRRVEDGRLYTHRRGLQRENRRKRSKKLGRERGDEKGKSKDKVKNAEGKGLMEWMGGRY